jgi:hypothetical protein
VPVDRKELDKFIDEIVCFFKDIINKLNQSYSFSAVNLNSIEDYLDDVSKDVKIFFNTLK